MAEGNNATSWERPLAEAYAALKASEAGLAAAEAQARLAVVGPNRLEEDQRQRDGDGFRELPDGRPLRFGPVSRASRPLIERAVARLSPLTSYRRFFTVRYRLSDAELDALTNLDGVDRFAVGASIRNGSEVDGVGVARFVRDRERPRVADLALLVVDAFQGVGVGHTLLARLASAALARGIDTFRGMVLIDNAPMLRLLRALAPGLRLARVDDYYEVEAPLVAGPLSSMTFPSGSST